MRAEERKSRYLCTRIRSGSEPGGCRQIPTHVGKYLIWIYDVEATEFTITRKGTYSRDRLDPLQGIGSHGWRIGKKS
ncbi:protein of unknown function [Methylocaldum szegediense]|uniref:Uncharacterized protein n=1 Tax=Methylocaldum szegediense TaxID=73780 RepID=A0ABN8X346_9GAMM|nr:protein of unknown function [Methylocaldum szegediense]